ncbi:MAG: mucoidy inhibitor MuiA family protein [Chloroflexota bacterium]
MDVTLETAVSHVTVYPDRARITVQSMARLEAGTQRLLVEELPLSLAPDSLRVSGEGTAHVRILGVDVVRRHYEQTPTERVRDLENQIEALEDEQQALVDETAVWQAQTNYLDGLRQASGAFAKGLARGRSSIADQADLLDFMRRQDEAARRERQRLAVASRDLKRRLERLRQELKGWQSARPRQRYQARVEVEVGQAGEFSAALTYVVNQAGWQPIYDVRLLTKESEPVLALDYMAQITQKTGQDWSGVSLTVSTARPTLNQRLPQQQPWYLDVYRPPTPLPRARAQGGERAEMAEAVMTMAAPAPMPQAVQEAETAVADLVSEAGGTAVRFQVGGHVDIPSDGSPHKTTLAQFRLAPTLDYVAVPYHTDAVFRRAVVTNSSGGPLLPGSAALFVNDEFIGQTRLEYTPHAAELELHLGVEEAITVERELTRRDVDKRLLRDNRQMRFGYKISLKNLRSDTVRVTLHDQIPVGRHEQIKVKLEEANPQPAEKSELNLLEWHLQLDPNQEKEIHYTYLVEHPRSLEITGLRE